MRRAFLQSSSFRLFAFVPRCHRAFVVLIATALLGLGACDGFVPESDGGDPSDDVVAQLATLELVGSAQLSSEFDPQRFTYDASGSVVSQQVSIVVTPTDPRATMTLNGTGLEAGVPFGPVSLGDETTLAVTVNAPGALQAIYRVNVRRDRALEEIERISAAGRSMAVDGEFFVVGTTSRDEATVYRRTPSGWVFDAALKNDGVQFGSSVAISGETIAVGNLSTDVVSLFVRRPNGWMLEQTVENPNAPPEGEADGFGISVALEGDVLVVGADREDSAASGVDGDALVDGSADSGAAYVFRRTTSGFVLEAYLKPSNTAPEQAFGRALAISGETVAVGSPRESTAGDGVDPPSQGNAVLAGAVYVFRVSGDSWKQEAFIKATNSDSPDSFGEYLDIDGDRLVVGANLESSSSRILDQGEELNDAFAAGAAYLYERTAGVWQLETYLKASNAEGGDRFGDRVALAGDLVFVGSLSEDSGATGIDGTQSDNSASASGAGYLFRRGTGGWRQAHYLKSSSAEASSFGLGVALSQDTLVVSDGGSAHILE